MRLNTGLFSLLSSAILLVSPAVATDFYFYGSSSCSGDSINAYNVGAEACAIANFNAYSVYFNNVPLNGKGQVYSSSGCSAYVSEGGGGYYCMSTSITGGSAIRAANWFNRSSGRLVRKDRINDEEPTRYSVRYELPDSTVKEVEIPPAELERAVKLLEVKDYEALEKFPVFEH